MRPDACLQRIVSDELSCDFAHRSGIEHDPLETRKLESCTDRVSPRTSADIEHDLAAGEIHNLWPCQRGSHTGTVHRTGKKTREIRFFCVRLEHFLTARVSLGRVRLHRLEELIQRTHRIVVDDEIEVGAEVRRASVEKVVLREWSKRVQTISKLKKAECYGGG